MFFLHVSSVLILLAFSVVPNLSVLGLFDIPLVRNLSSLCSVFMFLCGPFSFIVICILTDLSFSTV